MRLLHNWKAVLRYAWSIRFLVLAAVLSGVEVALPLAVGMIPIPAGIFAARALKDADPIPGDFANDRCWQRAPTSKNVLSHVFKLGA